VKVPRWGIRALVTASFVGVVMVGRCLHRVQVVGDSMAPTLLKGDRLVVVGRPGGPLPGPRRGSVVAIRDPGCRDRVLIKRVASVDHAAGTVEVLGDSPAASTDSRSFGPVRLSSIVGTAVYRYAPPGRTGRGPWLAEYGGR
jgi:nickel-type superoxide dismutase maturation protease